MLERRALSMRNGTQDASLKYLPSIAKARIGEKCQDTWR